MLDLDLPGMTCGGCARGVTAIIRDIDPQATVETDVEHRRARVTTTAAPETLKAALTEAGYMG